MAQFILKDSKGKEQTFDHETIYVRDTNGELVQFTQGEGDIPAVVQPLEVTENGTYTAPDGVDGYSEVTVNVDPTKITVLREQEMTGFALDAEFGYAKGDTEPTFTLTEGEKYFVTWDGVTYETTALPADSFADGAVYVGNGSPMGLTGNGEPFAIAYMNGMIFYLAFTDASESHTVGIYQSAIKEIVLQDKTITENGEYTADEGFDGLGNVTVDVAGSGSETKFKSAIFTATGTWNEQVTINFGFKPDFLFVFAGSSGSSAVSIGTSNFLFKGGSQKWKDMFGSAYLDYYYVSSSKIYSGRGSSAYVIDSTDTNCPINKANENGFNFGVTHASGSYNVLAIGL